MCNSGNGHLLVIQQERLPWGISSCVRADKRTVVALIPVWQLYTVLLPCSLYYIRLQDGFLLLIIWKIFQWKRNMTFRKITGGTAVYNRNGGRTMLISSPQMKEEKLVSTVKDWPNNRCFSCLMYVASTLSTVRFKRDYLNPLKYNFQART